MELEHPRLLPVLDAEEASAPLHSAPAGRARAGGKIEVVIAQRRRIAVDADPTPLLQICPVPQLVLTQPCFFSLYLLPLGQLLLAFVPPSLSSVSSTAKARGTAKASKSKIAPAPTAVTNPIDLAMAMAPHPSICSCRIQPLACHAAYEHDVAAAITRF